MGGGHPKILRFPKRPSCISPIAAELATRSRLQGSRNVELPSQTNGPFSRSQHRHKEAVLLTVLVGKDISHVIPEVHVIEPSHLKTKMVSQDLTAIPSGSDAWAHLFESVVSNTANMEFYHSRPRFHNIIPPCRQRCNISRPGRSLSNILSFLRHIIFSVLSSNSLVWAIFTISLT